MASGSQNNTSFQAQKWTNLRAFTIGNTAKDVDGTTAVSWSKNEILGASDSTKFYRGDKTWSNTLTSTLILDNGSINGELLRLVGVNDKTFSFKLTSPSGQTDATNVDIGWDWAAGDGAGAAFRSALFPNQPGYFVIYARTNTTDEYTLVGKTDGTLTWTGKIIPNTGNTTGTVGGATDPVWVNAGVITAITAGTTAQFYRGDKTWSNTLNGAFTANGTITANGGYLKSTANSNTVTIGSQNASFTHIYNSANIPFIFNNTVESTTGDLGSTSYPWHNIYIGPSNGAGIYYKGTQNTYRMIRFIDNASDIYGNGISIGGGGLTVLGSGESADTILSNLSLTGAGGTETTYIGSDDSIEFYPSINSWDASARIWMTAGVLNIGVDGNTTRENSLNIYSGAGRIQLYSAASKTGNRGLWVPAHGSGSSKNIILVDTNNNITFNGNVTGNCSGSSGSCTGNAATSTSTRYVQCPDTRSTNPAPSTFSAANGVSFDFKQGSVIGLTSANYSGVMSFRPYASETDWSGGNAHQLAFNNAGLYWRQGGSSWGSWTQIVTNSGTWGISVTGNAATVSRATFGDSGNGEHNANNIASNGLYYYTSNGPSKNDANQFTTTDGAIYCQAYSTTWVGQIAQDYRNGALAVRGKNNGTWSTWYSIPKMIVEDYPALLPPNNVNNWIKIGTANASYGLLPSQSGGAGSGHNYLGTSSWYWKYAYIDQIYGYLNGNISGSSTSCTGNAATATNADKVDNYHASSLWRSDGGTWNGNANIACTPTAANQEYSFDLGNAYTGTYWHVWSGKNSKSILICYNDNMNVSVPNGTLTAKAFSGPLTGNVTGNCSGSSGSCTGNSATTSKLSDSAHSWTATEVYNYMTARVLKAGDTMTGCLSIKTNTNQGTDALLYIEQSNNNDWGIKVNKTTSYDYGIQVTCATTAAHAVQVSGRITGTTVYGAVWNDYAEFRKGSTTKGGVCVYEQKNGLTPTIARLQAGCRITSDTFGFAIGETEEAQTPIAVCGRVLVYPYVNRQLYQPGDAVCSAPNGTVDIMTRDEIKEYPDRIVGIVSEIPNYEIWHAGAQDGNHEIQVNGRIWIYVR